MNLKKLNIGILHSIMGKNDGVSIVIDQTIESMQKHMGISLDNIFLLSALAPARMNKTEHTIFWHKNNNNKYILQYFDKEPPDDYEAVIEASVETAIEYISSFVKTNDIDLFIVHNACHPANFIYAVAVGKYFKKLKQSGRILPRYLLWWHDSYLERPRFAHPNDVIRKYLEFLPGASVDGVVFINTAQQEVAKKLFSGYWNDPKKTDLFFKRKTAVIPNLVHITWNWQRQIADHTTMPFPPEDDFNSDFFDTIGLTRELEKQDKTVYECDFLLQHTRIVPRKRIDIAIEFAFLLQKYCLARGEDRATALIISGHSGDEDDTTVQNLKKKEREMCAACPELRGRVIVLFAERFIFPEREIIVDRKLYRFRDIPAIIAKWSGIGTYFSEIEGFGNNLLEMVSSGLPAVINQYPVYKKDLKPLGFKFFSIENAKLNNDIIRHAHSLLRDKKLRRNYVIHNIQTASKKLSHNRIVSRLKPLINNLFNFE